MICEVTVNSPIRDQRDCFVAPRTPLLATAEGGARSRHCHRTPDSVVASKSSSEAISLLVAAGTSMRLLRRAEDAAPRNDRGGCRDLVIVTEPLATTGTKASREF